MSRSLVLAFALTAGCAPSVKATSINPSPYPLQPRPVESVELFTSGPPADRHYVDVAFLETTPGDPGKNETARHFGVLRKRAAEMGCDAIIIGGVAAHRDAVDISDEKTVTATCIVYTGS